MLQPQSASSPRCVHTTANDFYAQLRAEGFTAAQIFDLSLRLLDQVAHEGRSALDSSESLTAK